jgi:heme-degrading monooxygenase HmoA
MGGADAEESRLMILEVATLQIKPGQTAAFEFAFAQAQRIVASMSGYISHQLQRCIENDHQYLLHVHWATLEDHTVGFRQSLQYQQWRSLLHHFYDPFPTVLHYAAVDLK